MFSLSERKRNSYRWLAGFMVFFGVSFTVDGTTDCPNTCFCNLPSKIVYCSRRGLTSVPVGIAPDTLQLNLNANNFQTTTLQQSNFTGYDSLEHLYLSECGIEKIEVGTFALLANLKWLDLSNNRIRTLSANSLSGLNLQHLFLNGNRHIHLIPESFEGLITTGIYLHDCSLVRLTPDILTPLNSSLKYLWLNGNEIDRFEIQFNRIFSGLQHLRLASNPLHCNCEVLWLKEFFDRSGDVFKGAVAPSCLTPHRLRGKFFNQLSLFDFRCQSPMFNNIETTFGRSTGRLKCTASGDPAPVLYWIQPSGKTSKYGPSEDEDTQRTEGVLSLHNDDGNTNLFGMYICIANNDAGNVTLTINVSWPLLGNSLLSESPPALPLLPSDKESVDSASLSDGLLPWQRGTTTTSLLSSSSSSLYSPASQRESVHKLRTGSDVTASTEATFRGRQNFQGHNYTVVGQFDLHPVSKSRLFTVTELVCAIIGTHVATLALCLAAIPIYYRARWMNRKNRGLTKHPESPPPGGYTRPHQQLLHHHHQQQQPQMYSQNEAQVDRIGRQVSLGESAHLTTGGGNINNRFLTDYLIASGSLR